MQSLSDDAWVARLRAAYAARGDDFEAALAPVVPTSAQAPAIEDHGPCPFCAGHPPLRPFPREFLGAAAPLSYCPACYGFWAPEAAIASGVTGDAGEHPALRAKPAPARCRSCFGVLMPDGRCSKCKQPAPLYRCPQCSQTMERRSDDGITLDHCSTCRGVWFDMGELTAALKIVDTPSLAERFIELRSAENTAMLAATHGNGGAVEHGNHHHGGPHLGAAFELLGHLVRHRF